MAELKNIAVRTKKTMIGFRGLLESRLASMAPLLTLLVLIILFSITSQKFLTPDNLFNITGQIAILAMVASMTLVVLLGEIDLSVANIATMTGIIIAMLYTSKSECFQAMLYRPFWLASLQRRL